MDTGPACRRLPRAQCARRPLGSRPGRPAGPARGGRPLLTGHSPLTQGPDALAAPSGEHPLGTDEFGRDLLSRTLYGIRLDLLVAFTAVPLGAVAGIGLGLLCALHPSLDVVLQRAFDVMLAFTALVLGVTLAAILGPGTAAVFWTVTGVNIPLFGRITRDAVRVERDREYVLAAVALGARRLRILLGDILPNILDALVVQAALSSPRPSSSRAR